jgi:hypothetical protein
MSNACARTMQWTWQEGIPDGDNQNERATPSRKTKDPGKEDGI